MNHKNLGVYYLFIIPFSLLFWPAVLSAQSEAGLPIVSIRATKIIAREHNQEPGVFTVRCEGCKNQLTVDFEAKGMAIPGDDYNQLSGSIVIPSDKTSADIEIRARDDSDVEPDKDVIVALQPSINYIVGIPSSDKVTIISDDATVTKVDPEIGQPGDKITISGDGFGENFNGGTYTVKFISSSCGECKKVYDAQILERTNKKITALVPSIPEKEIFNIKVIADGKEAGGDVRFGVYPINLVEMAIMMRDKGVPESVITEELFDLSEKLQTSTFNAENVFGNYRPTYGETEKMLQAKLSDDFRAKFLGLKQYVNIGVAAIWLNQTRDLTTSPLIRIFLEPRSYFQPRPSFFSWQGPGFLGGLKNKFLETIKKIDLNFGYTTITPTDAPSKDEKKSYALVGVSYEINRAALFNFGLAAVPGDIEGNKTQYYLGITIDENSLRAVKLIK